MFHSIKQCSLLFTVCAMLVLTGCSSNVNWFPSKQFTTKDWRHNPILSVTQQCLDDVWHNPETNEIHIVDYKSTASAKNEEGDGLKKVVLEGAYKEGYKRQMDIYSWIMRRNGFNVSKDCYFVYVNGDQHFEDGMLLGDPEKGKMMFDVQLIKYVSDDSWVSKTLADLKSCLLQDSCPDHSQSGYGPKGDKPCENFVLFEGMRENNLI